MQQTTITTREFLRNFTKFATAPKKGAQQAYTVVKHGKIIGTFIPHEENNAWWKGIDPAHYSEAQQQHSSDKKVTLQDLEKLRFNSGEKDLSRRIDEICYGIA